MGLGCEIDLMAFYTFQALILGAALLILARQNGKWRAYSTLYVLVWTLAVIAIKYRFGVEQSTFYSNDQQAQLAMYDRLLQNGLLLSPQQFIADRYLIIVPIRWLNLFGIEPILAMKFLQAICLLLLYQVCIKFLERNNLTVKLTYAIFFAGPLFIFLSTLGLRDLEIALAATYFFIGQNRHLKELSLLVLIPLRPHLAVALTFGWLVSKFIKQFQFKKTYVVLTVLTIVSFALGSYGYVIGRNVQFGSAITEPAIFQQDAWWRYLSNLVGLQFLSLDDRIVNISVVRLLALRLFFVDSFLVPICFVVTLMAQKIEHSLLRVQVFLSFTFFLGLASQTDFNSTRQNLPFLSTMGVLALLGLLKRDNEVKNSELTKVASVK